MADRDERGAALVWVAILTPLILLFTAFAVDVAMLDLAKAKIQAAVDAAALAGSSAGEVKQLWDVRQEPLLDANGNEVLDQDGNVVLVHVPFLVDEYVVIPSTDGYARARAAWAANAQQFPGGQWTLVSWEGHVESGVGRNEDTYVVSVDMRVKTFLAGPLMAGMSGDRSFMELTIHRTGSAKARKQ